MKSTSFLAGVAFAAIAGAAQAAEFTCKQDGREFSLTSDRQQQTFVTTFKSTTGITEASHAKQKVYVMHSDGQRFSPPALNLEATAKARANQKRELIAKGQQFCNTGLER